MSTSYSPFREGCRRFVEVLSRKGRGTIQDLRAAMAIPRDLDPRWLGAIPFTGA